jgi:hypothetical protein
MPRMILGRLARKAGLEVLDLLLVMLARISRLFGWLGWDRNNDAWAPCAPGGSCAHLDRLRAPESSSRLDSESSIGCGDPRTLRPFTDGRTGSIACMDMCDVDIFLAKLHNIRIMGHWLKVNDGRRELGRG